MAFAAPLSAKARRCGEYPFRQSLRLCHLPQGDGFGGGSKVSGIAKKASPWGSWLCVAKTEGVNPTRENGNPERPQTLRVSEIINNFSLAYAQSAAEGIPDHFRCSSMVWMRVLAR